MTTALLLLLFGTEAAAEATPAIRCLRVQDGFISMRLRGSIEEDLDWAEPELECTGMSAYHRLECPRPTRGHQKRGVEKQA